MCLSSFDYAYDFKRVSNCICIQIYSYLRSAHGVCICTYHKPVYYYVFFCYMLTMYSLLNKSEIKHSPLKIMPFEGQIWKIYNMVKSSSTKTIRGDFYCCCCLIGLHIYYFINYLLMVFIIISYLYHRDYSRN